MKRSLTILTTVDQRWAQLPLVNGKLKRTPFFLKILAQHMLFLICILITRHAIGLPPVRVQPRDRTTLRS